MYVYPIITPRRGDFVVFDDSYETVLDRHRERAGKRIECVFSTTSYDEHYAYRSR